MFDLTAKHLAWSGDLPLGNRKNRVRTRRWVVRPRLLGFYRKIGQFNDQNQGFYTPIVRACKISRRTYVAGEGVEVLQKLDEDRKLSGEHSRC